MTRLNKWKLENILSGHHISSSPYSDKHQTQIKTLPEEHVSRLLVPEHKQTNKQTNKRTNTQTNKQTNKQGRRKKCTILRWEIKVTKNCTTRLEHYRRYGLCNVDINVPTCTLHVTSLSGNIFCIGHQAFMHMKPRSVLKTCTIFRQEKMVFSAMGWKEASESTRGWRGVVTLAS
jgi:hypothetical protein